jgi:hypothetical protein
MYFILVIVTNNGQALSIAEMFPETPFEELLQAFDKNGGNLDATLAYLFQSKNDSATDQRAKRKHDDAPNTTFVVKITSNLIITVQQQLPTII